MSETQYPLIDTETGIRYREVARRRIGGEVWVDLAHCDSTERARSVRLDRFERIFKPEQPIHSTQPAARELAEARSRWQWQPIETAPKDGRAILCTWVQPLPDGHMHWCGVIHVLSWFKDWHGEGHGAWVLDGDFNVHFEPDGVHETPPKAYGAPTHWMPLPDPPTEVSRPTGAEA